MCYLTIISYAFGVKVKHSLHRKALPAPTYINVVDELSDSKPIE
jgi:hypothetical protein